MTNCQLLFFLHKLHMYILTPHHRTSLLVIRQAIMQKAATLMQKAATLISLRAAA